MVSSGHEGVVQLRAQTNESLRPGFATLPLKMF